MWNVYIILSTYYYASTIASNVGDVSEIKLTERQQNILNLIKKTPSISAKQMSETLSVTSRTIERDIFTLKEIGVLKREGNDNDGEWILFRIYIDTKE